jgi:regulator of RNase E activity RraA
VGIDDCRCLVRAGDLIMGDLNGVVCIPRELVKPVVELLDPLSQANEKILKDLKSGQPFVQSSRKHRASLAVSSSK